MRVNKDEITRKSYNLMEMGDKYKVKSSVHTNRPDRTICRDFPPNRPFNSCRVY